MLSQVVNSARAGRDPDGPGARGQVGRLAVGHPAGDRYLMADCFPGGHGGLPPPSALSSNLICVLDARAHLPASIGASGTTPMVTV